ncbi:MAG TPA: M13 family metallopeptidase [Candidatus Sulfotelmatobacter sp.]|nr:M13 family metallopeptidase [Candidatus Sulfotelmatobacter sp.]
MRLFPAALRLAGAVALFAGLAIASTHQHARADDALPEPFDPSALDRTANVCTHFFDFATGGYRKAHPIPAAYSEYGYIEALVDQTREVVRATLERAQKNPGPAGSVSQQIGTLYGSCMDAVAIERLGLRPLAPELARIDALRSRAALTAEIAHLHLIGVDAGFSLSPTQDFKNSSSVIAEIDQSGIGLPERDYYLRTDEASRALRAQYVVHVRRMLALAGDASAAADATAVMAFETRLASGSLPIADLRDPAAVYHPLRAPAVATLLPHFAFVPYLRATDVPIGGIINVAEPRFLRAFDQQLAAAPLATWRAYLRWRLLDAYATTLPKRFDDENFAFRGRILNGTTAQLPRWKRCVEVANTYLGMAVGQAYVAAAFSPAAKQRALDMTLRIKRAYRAELAALTWMTPPTKRYALAKLDAMGLKVGYPDRWRSYRGYVVTPGTYLVDVEAGRVFDHGYQVHKIGRPLDRSEWDMTPQTVNAYDDIQRNEIVLPAAQLQRPFFDPAADDAANLGATGAGTVGHEMTHGFDDEGHKFDLHGNVRNWWTPKDLANFDTRADCVIRQFDRTVAIGDVHYQGKLVAGEAIADLGGTVIGYRALEDSLGTGAREKVDGFTPEQRYFLAFAQSWAESVRPEAARTQALTDPHPLPKDRVEQTVANVPEWYTAFDCPKPPKPVCTVW